MKLKFTLALTSLVLLTATTLGVAQERQRLRLRDQASREQAPGRGHRHPGQSKFAEQRRHARNFVRSLELTPEQREEMRRVGRDLRPLANELRPKFREALREARELRLGGQREAAREYLKQELKPLREAARARGLPLVRPLIDQLTPEQRARCEERARAHGREFDPDRAASRLGRFLSSGRAQARCEQR